MFTRVKDSCLVQPQLEWRGRKEGHGGGKGHLLRFNLSATEFSAAEFSSVQL